MTSCLVEMLLGERAKWWGADVGCKLMARAGGEELTREDGTHRGRNRGEAVRGGERLL